MSDRIYWRTSTVYRTTFMVFQTDGVTPKTGLVNSDFTKFLSKDGAFDATAITVAEISSGSFPGAYVASLTPGSDGYWFGRLMNATYAKRGIVFDFQALTGFTAGGGGGGSTWDDLVASHVGAGSFGLLVGGRLDTTVSSRADGAQYTTGRAAKIDLLDAAVTSRASAADFTTARGAKLDNLDAPITTTTAAPTFDRIADHVLRRNYSNAHAALEGDALNPRSLIGAVAKMTNKSQVIGGQLKFFHEDDLNVFGVQSTFPSPGADPIIGLGGST